MGEAKVVIAAVAMTSTLALWNMFSKQMKLEAAATTSMPTEVAVTTGDTIPTLVLPPLPTLILPLPDSGVVVSPIQPVPDTAMVSQPPAQTGGVVLLGGSAPGSQPQPQQQKPRSSSNHKPAARTRSSH
jgi:hypothetical protein